MSIELHKIFGESQANSVVIKKFSVSQKQVYETTTGECLKSSNSHVFPVRI
jgi:hypothetical protein